MQIDMKYLQSIKNSLEKVIVEQNLSKERSAELEKMCQEAAAVAGNIESAQLDQLKTDFEAFSAKLQKEATREMVPGLEEDVRKNYSLTKMIQSQMSTGSKSRDLAGYEWEINDILREKMSGNTRDKNSFIVPHGYLLFDREKYQAIMSTNTSGGFLGPVIHGAGIEPLVPMGVHDKLGVTTLRNLKGRTYEMPRWDTFTVSMVAETTAAASQDLTFDNPSLTAKTATAVGTFSSRLNFGSDPNIDAVLRKQLSSRINAKITQQLLEGTGAGQEVAGLRGLVPAANRVDFAGAGSDREDWITMQGVVGDSDGIEDNTGAYVMRKITQANILKENATNIPVNVTGQHDRGLPAGMLPFYLGYPIETTNTIANSLVAGFGGASGVGGDRTHVYYSSAWSMMALGFFGPGIELSLSNSGSTNNHAQRLLELVGWVDFDSIPMQAANFSVGFNVLDE